MDKKELYRLVGLRIRAIRNSKNMSLMELSDKLDMEYNNLIRIEKGRTNPTIGTLYEICRALDIKIVDIMDVG